MRTGLWILGLAILLSTTAAAQIRVETIDGTHAGELLDITAKALKIKSKAGIRIVALDTIFNIRFVGAPPVSKGTRFELVGGDRYYGKLVSGSADELEVDSKSCGRIKLMTDDLTEIRFPIDPRKAAKVREVPARKNLDIVYLANADHAYGVLGGITKQKDGGFVFQLKDGDETLSFRQEELYRIQITPFNKAPKSAAFHMLVSCWDGSQFSATLQKFSQRILWTRTLLGETRKVALSSIRSLQFKNGGFFYLTDLRPSKIEHVPFFSYKWPPKFDRNRRGGPLKMRGKIYHKGIGMQSKTRISYEIAGKGYREFRCLVGIDDMAGDGGSVIFRVYLDGKKVHQTIVLRGGMPVVALKIGLKDKRLLTLEADYADNAHVNDLANWVNPVLLK